MNSRPMILFVCTGNTCRSYMAERIAKQYLQKLQLEDKPEIVSAGTAGFSAQPASRQASAVMAEMGIPGQGHQARLLNQNLIEQASLILTMTASQRAHILDLAPESKGKVFLLKEYALIGQESTCGHSSDIEDPFGQSVEYYRVCAADLAPLVSRALDRFLGL